MGAWGYGLLENDSSQDGLVGILRDIEGDILRLDRRRPAEAIAARVGGAVGLLLQLQSWASFDPEKVFFPRLRRVLNRQEPCFEALSTEAVHLIEQVREGNGPDLVYRPGRLSAPLRRSLFPANKDFPMQRTISKRDPALFAHPDAGRYVQEVADRLVRRVHRDFRKRYIAGDLATEGGNCIAGLAVLLLIEPCQVKPSLFREWWEYHRAATAGRTITDQYEKRWRACLRLACETGLNKFSPEPPTTPLNE
jgi:hypothetical protein